MDLKKLTPDFNALGKTNFANPTVDTKNIFGVAALVASLLMVVFVFCPWFGMSAEGESVSRLGITLWYGILGFIFALATLCFSLYKHYNFAFFSSLVCVLMGILGMACYASLTIEGETIDAEYIKLAVKAAKMAGAELGVDVDVIRWGSILYFLSALVAAAGSFCAAVGLTCKACANKE